MFHLMTWKQTVMLFAGVYLCYGKTTTEICFILYREEQHVSHLLFQQIFIAFPLVKNGVLKYRVYTRTQNAFNSCASGADLVETEAKNKDDKYVKCQLVPRTKVEVPK